MLVVGCGYFCCLCDLGGVGVGCCVGIGVDMDVVLVLFVGGLVFLVWSGLYDFGCVVYYG